jgi:hypothetical protein
MTIQLSVGEIEDFFIEGNITPIDALVIMYKNGKTYGRFEMELDYKIRMYPGRDTHTGTESENGKKLFCVDIPRYNVCYLHYITVNPAYPIHITLDPGDVHIASDDYGYIRFEDPIPLGALVYTGLFLTVEDIPEDAELPTIVLGVSVFKEKIVFEYPRHVTTLPDGRMFIVQDKAAYVKSSPLIKAVSPIASDR